MKLAGLLSPSLRADFPLASLPNAAARTVARALQTYGMILSDGGNIPLTFEASAATLLGSHDLDLIKVTDFDIVASPDPAVTSPRTCVRTPPSSPAFLLAPRAAVPLAKY